MGLLRLVESKKTHALRRRPGVQRALRTEPFAARDAVPSYLAAQSLASAGIFRNLESLGD